MKFYSQIISGYIHVQSMKAPGMFTKTNQNFDGNPLSFKPHSSCMDSYDDILIESSQSFEQGPKLYHLFTSDAAQSPHISFI